MAIVSVSMYKPNQGTHARIAAAAALLLLVLLASWRLFVLTEVEKRFGFFGYNLPYAAMWSGGLFIVLGLLVGLLTSGLRTGIRGLDAKTQGFVDLLIDTQTELQKVSWPSRDELIRATGVVLCCIMILGVFLFVADVCFSKGMQFIGVLPKPK